MFSTEPVLMLERADIFQDTKLILGDISFSIQKGEFVYLIGRTGSGKTSLLKTLYADLKLQSGQGNVAGTPLHRIDKKQIPFLRRKIGIVFQDFQLFFDRNVEENLRFVLKATGWTDKKKMTDRISEVLMQVGLGTAQRKMPHQLSGGEQQRVVIARAMFGNGVRNFVPHYGSYPGFVLGVRQNSRIKSHLPAGHTPGVYLWALNESKLPLKPFEPVGKIIGTQVAFHSGTEPVAHALNHLGIVAGTNYPACIEHTPVITKAERKEFAVRNQQ